MPQCVRHSERQTLKLKAAASGPGLTLHILLTAPLSHFAGPPEAEDNVPTIFHDSASGWPTICPTNAVWNVEEATMSGDRILLRVHEAAEALGISRSRMYELLGAGAVPALKLGRSTRIP